MKSKALHDMDSKDHRLHGQLLVRLDFVATWSAARTLAYYRVIRELVDHMREDMYENGRYMINESLPMKPGYQYQPYLTAGKPVMTTVLVHQHKYVQDLKEKYTDESFKQYVSDFEKLARYKEALHWVLSQMEKVPHEKKYKKHPDAYYVR